MCSVQFSICSMKCTGADAGAGSGVVCSVQRAMCSVQCLSEYKISAKSKFLVIDMKSLYQ